MSKCAFCGSKITANSPTIDTCRACHNKIIGQIPPFTPVVEIRPFHEPIEETVVLAFAVDPDKWDFDKHGEPDFIVVKR